MNVQITGRHMDLSKALKERTEKEVSQFMRFFDNIVYTHITFEAEKVGYEATLETKVQGDVLTATSKGDNPFAALELATDKMKRQLRDHKTKLKERKRHAQPTQEALEEMRRAETEE
jgi:putative sigma-54 modulation protein